MSRQTWGLRSARLTAVVGAVAVALWGCGGTLEEDLLPEDTLGESELGELENELHQSQLQVTPFQDPKGIGSRGQTQARVVITSAAGYQAYFGHAPPSAVNFAAGEVVVFYAAGEKVSGGYDARVTRVAQSQSGRTLYVGTELSIPGPDCVTTPALTRPYALVKVTPKRKPWYARFTHGDVVTLCNPDPCATVRCAAGTECVVLETFPPQASCQPISAPACGGNSTYTCPGAGSCEPPPPCEKEGIDCPTDRPGRCACNAIGACAPGSVWDSSPYVCGCVATGAVDGGSGGGSDGGTGGGIDAGSPGQKCGDTTCGAGLVCCNASCGICTPPGYACIQIACN